MLERILNDVANNRSIRRMAIHLRNGRTRRKVRVNVTKLEIIATVTGAIILIFTGLMAWLAYEDWHWDEHKRGLAKVPSIPPQQKETP